VTPLIPEPHYESEVPITDLRAARGRNLPMVRSRPEVGTQGATLPFVSLSQLPGGDPNGLADQIYYCGDAYNSCAGQYGLSVGSTPTPATGRVMVVHTMFNTSALETQRGTRRVVSPPCPVRALGGVAQRTETRPMGQ
jgi:hypothetical protein